MPTAPASVPARGRKPVRAKLGPQILAQLVAGASVDEIAQKEALTPKRVEKWLRDELRKRWVAPAQDYGRLQIARLDAILAKLTTKAEEGDIAAIDRILRVLDRLDRYHGFGKLAPAARTYDEHARQKLMEKLDRAATRLLPPPKDNA